MSDASGPRVPAGVVLAGVEEIEITIDKLVAGGDGLGRFAGVPVFVPRSAPGDRLRARIVERRPGYGRAEIVEVLAGGPARRRPPCPHFGPCGGCDLQQIEDGEQVRLKAAATVETLARLGGIAPAGLEVVAGDAWGYRLRAQVHTAIVDGTVAVGYHARGSRELVAVTACPILAPELERAVTGLAARLPAEPPRRIDLALGDDEALSVAPLIEGQPHGEITLTIDDLVYGFDARCFFQAHRGLLPRLIEAVVGDERGEEACDLYAGVGLFTLPLARRYARVVAVEGDRIAARYARRNARRNRLANVTVEARAVESWIARLPRDVDRVVADPPRAGLGGGVLRALARRPPRRLTYVSCHAATLARDLKALAAAYRLERLTLVDLFPQTGHMEAVAHLVAR